VLNAEKVRYKAGLEVLESTKTVHQKIIRFFPDTFMGNGHDGLARIAKRHDIDVTNLRWGEYVIFMNKNKTALKLYSQGNLIAHLRMTGSNTIDMHTISMIPRFFNGTRINYDAALREVLTKKMRLQ
jgi:hypothetical protein